METFSGYGFNHSHSISYSYLGYVCQYLKTHYPLEWWCSCLKHTIDKPDKFGEFFQAAQDYIILPDINYSTNEFYIRDNKIQFPFNTIKEIGLAANKEIEKKRPYTSIDDFYERIYKRVVNKKVFENLIIADCFQAWGKFQELLTYYYEKLRGEKVPDKFLHLNKEEKLNLRTKALDFIVLDYYSIYGDIINDPDYLINVDDLNDTPQGKIVMIAGKIIERKNITTKRKKEKMAILKIQNAKSIINITVWPDEVRNYDSKLQVDNVIRVTGTVDYFSNHPQILATHIYTIEDLIRIKNKRRERYERQNTK